MAKENEPKIKVGPINQVALMVKDARKVAEDYWNILGIGPWDIREAKPPELHGQAYYGKESDFTAKVGYAKSGSMQIEIIQPMSAKNIWNDFMAIHGEGMHHLQFRVDNITAVTEIMNAEAIPTIMSGRYAEGGFAYYGTEDSLKCIWECFQPPEKSYPMHRYPTPPPGK